MQPHGAIEYYDKALALNPHYVDALDNEGIALDEIGNHVGAMHLYDKALAIMPKDIYALDNKGETLHALGNYTGAMHLYHKALTIDSKFENVLREGLALDKMGNHTGALTYLDIEYRVYVRIVIYLEG